MDNSVAHSALIAPSRPYIVEPATKRGKPKMAPKVVLRVSFSNLSKIASSVRPKYCVKQTIKIIVTSTDFDPFDKLKAFCDIVSIRKGNAKNAIVDTEKEPINAEVKATFRILVSLRFDDVYPCKI
jgi:hypothetical protein